MRRRLAASFRDQRPTDRVRRFLAEMERTSTTG
jgi:hypothetical protein